MKDGVCLWPMSVSLLSGFDEVSSFLSTFSHCPHISPTTGPQQQHSSLKAQAQTQLSSLRGPSQVFLPGTQVNNNKAF